MHNEQQPHRPLSSVERAHCNRLVRDLVRSEVQWRALPDDASGHAVQGVGGDWEASRDKVRALDDELVDELLRGMLAAARRLLSVLRKGGVPDSRMTSAYRANPHDAAEVASVRTMAWLQETQPTTNAADITLPAWLRELEASRQRDLAIALSTRVSELVELGEGADIATENLRRAVFPGENSSDYLA